VSDKYAFIDAEYATGCAPTIERMCRWLRVSRSGYYEWLHRTPSATAQRRELLKIKIRAVFKASDGTYGYRRLHAALVAGGDLAGPELVRQLMREQNLVACQPRPWRTTTVQSGEQTTTPDLVGQDFTADARGHKLVGDITYISTWAGWLYLATVIDCFNKEVIGYAMADHMRTSLVADALNMAARNHTLAGGLHFPFRPRHSIHLNRIRRHQTENAAITGPHRMLLRQCAGGILFRGPQERAGVSHRLSDPGQSETRYCPLY
jgi:putative transposase